jgi:hypothetical protein
MVFSSVFMCFFASISDKHVANISSICFKSRSSVAAEYLAAGCHRAGVDVRTGEAEGARAGVRWCRPRVDAQNRVQARASGSARALAPS